MQQYVTLSKEYENENRKTSDDDGIDYFIEYIKPFYIKKPKVIELYLIINNCNLIKFRVQKLK